MARSTEKAYVYWCRRYILYHEKQHPLDTGKQEAEAFLTHLAVRQHVSACTQNQAFSALLFLYREVLERDFGWLEDVVRAKRPKRIPAVFTHADGTLSNLAALGELSSRGGRLLAPATRCHHR